MSSNVHDRVRRSLAAHALGALDEEESATVDHHLELCSQCRAELAQLEEAATSLVEPADLPPADVWERVSKAIRDPLRRRRWERGTHEGHG